MDSDYGLVRVPLTLLFEVPRRSLFGSVSSLGLFNLSTQHNYAAFYQTMVFWKIIPHALCVSAAVPPNRVKANFVFESFLLLSLFDVPPTNNVIVSYIYPARR